MAVYTDVSPTALQGFLDDYAIGDPVQLTGILQGIENSNFMLETTGGKYVLTVFERRAAREDLPYFLRVDGTSGREWLSSTRADNGQ